MSVSFSCDKMQLQNALAIATRAMASRSTMEILEGVLLQSNASQIDVMCTDLSISIQTSIDAACEETFSVVMPGRLFHDIVRHLPAGEVKVTVDENNSVTVEGRGSRTTLAALSSEQFPAFPQVTDENPVEIEEKTFRDILRQSLFSAAQEDTRPILTGALLEIQTDAMKIVTLDGYRLSMRTAALVNKTEPREVVVPARCLDTMARLIGDSQETVHLHMEERFFMMEWGNTLIATRLMEGEFINYKQVLPKSSQTHVHLRVEEIADACERASLMARDGKNNLIQLQCEDDKLIITSNSESGQAYEEVACEKEGPNITVACNARYLSDALRALETEETVLEIDTPQTPFVFHPTQGSSYYYLVVPVRIYQN